MPDEDVGLANVVERFARSLALVLAVQLNEVMDPDMLFLGILEDSGALEREAQEGIPDTNLLRAPVGPIWQ